MNRLRSPTAEQIFSSWPGVEAASAGVGNDADTPLTPELIGWADVIFVMEQSHRAKVSAKFQRWLKGKQIVCLDIADEYKFMDPELVRLLEERVGQYLRSKS